MNIADIIGRSHTLFQRDVEIHRDRVASAIRGARVLVLGGAGSIGKEVTAEIFPAQSRPSCM